MYTIKYVVDLLGLPAPTIRAWERRYQIPRPHRTAAGYRLYSAEDVSLLRRMQQLVNTGVTPSQAAAELTGAGSETHPALSPGDVVALLEEGRPLDDAAFASLTTTAPLALARVADEWLMPLLTQVGEAWQRGSLSLVQEHAVSAAVIARLAAAYEQESRAGSPLVVLGLPPGATHEIGVLLFAVLLRRSGVDARYLGADLPVAAWVEAVSSPTTRLAITACHRRADVSSTRDLVERLRQVPGLRVAVGGRLQEEVGSAELLGPNFASALVSVVDSLTRSASDAAEEEA